MDYTVLPYKRIKATGLLFGTIVLLIGVFCGIAILLLDDVGIYDLLFILPFCYGMVSFIAMSFIGGRIWKSIVSILLFGGYFIKMVVTPFLFAMGGYESFLGSCVTEKGIIAAIIYMCLETITVLGLAGYLGRKVNQKFDVKINFPQYNTKVFNWAVCLLFLFLLVAYIAIPAISEIYIFLPFADFSEIAEIRWDNETIVGRGSIERYMYSLFGFLWPVFRMIMPSLLISRSCKKYGTRTGGMFLSFLCLLLPAILLGGDNIAPFIGIFIGIIVIYKLYGKKSVKYLVLAGFFAVGILAIVMLSKLSLMSDWRGATGVSVVAQMIHNYFPGFDNMAVVFDMAQENKLNTLFFDLYYAIPFKETLFGLRGDYIQDLFETYTETGGQIIPFMGQLAYYLGPLSPFILALFVGFAYKMERKAKRSDNFWRYFIYMYISVSTAMSLSIYSVSVYIRDLVNVVLPIYLIIKLIERRRGALNG